jgi:glycosyltransferase involved in cell wall biosynthesis
MLSQFYPPVVGGQERYVRNLAAGLAQRGHQVDVLTTATDTEMPEEQLDGLVRVRRARSGAQRFPILHSDPLRPHAMPVSDPVMSRAISAALSATDYDVIHAHDWAVNSALNPARHSRTPVVMTLHDYSHVCATKRLICKDAVCPGPSLGACLSCASAQYNPVVGPGVVAANFWSHRRRHRYVDAFIPVSSAVAASTGLRPSRFEIIPNFIPDDLVGNDATVHPNGPIVFVGDLSRDKGVDVLIDAYNRLDQPPDLVLAGRSISGTPLVLGPGARLAGVLPYDQVHALMASAAMVVVPSIVADCCPTVILEAMAAGRPVVGSATGGIVDLIIDGATGRLVPTGDASALAQAMASILDDPGLAQAMGTAGLGHVTRFVSSSIVERVESLYARVVRDYPRGRERNADFGDDAAPAMATADAGERRW